MQKQMQMFGSMGNILGMLPGLNIGKDARDKISHESEKQFKRIEVFIQSMTPQERSNPDLIDASRKKRIAKGCGMDLNEVNMFIKQFNQMRTMMSGLSGMKNMFAHAAKSGEKFNPHSKQGRHAMSKAMKMMRRFK